MIKQTQIVGVGLLFTISLYGLSGCSQVGKSARSVTTFGQQSGGSAVVDEKLIIPPSLQNPNEVKTTATTRKTQAERRKAPTRNSNFVSKKNYFIVVGTYPDQEQALDTFARLSSIGLSGATMETRTTKSGKNLHMVRLGPYHNQADIDEAKDSLTNDGLSQFKVVQN